MTLCTMYTVHSDAKIRVYAGSVVCALQPCRARRFGGRGRADGGIKLDYLGEVAVWKLWGEMDCWDGLRVEEEGRERNFSRFFGFFWLVSAVRLLVGAE